MRITASRWSASSACSVHSNATACPDTKSAESNGRCESSPWFAAGRRNGSTALVQVVFSCRVKAVGCRAIYRAKRANNNDQRLAFGHPCCVGLCSVLPPRIVGRDSYRGAEVGRWPRSANPEDTCRRCERGGRPNRRHRVARGRAHRRADPRAALRPRRPVGRHRNCTKKPRPARMSDGRSREAPPQTDEHVASR